MGKVDQNDPIDWEEYWKTQPSDEELEQQGIEIPETETDQSFFDWFNRVIEETLAEES